MRRPYVVAAVLVAVVAVATTVLIASRSTSSPPGTGPLGTGTPSPETQQWPGWGFTHTQFSADAGARGAVRSVQQALQEQPLVQVQAIMGWGAENPEPSPGEYDFDILDRRIEFIRQSGGIPVITLCCAPDWMKGGPEGATDWDQLEVAPLPENYADFADLAGVVAERYPDVHHFLVWNEFKGFWNEDDNTWDAEGYTDFYNQVHAAVKEAHPDALVGGPYVPMVSAEGEDSGSLAGDWGAVDPRVLDAFDYWLANNRGADFVVVDGHAVAPDGVDPFDAVAKFSAVNDWIRERTDLPIWWAEWYLDPAVEEWPADQQIAIYTAAMMEFARSGTQTALYWNPTPGGGSCATCLWTDTTRSEGGEALPLLQTLQGFTRWFPAGTELTEVDAPDGLRVLAQREAMVMVNTTDERLSATVGGTEVTLDPYETRWVPAL
ncbi:MAG TPA: hypothetical protein VHF92_07270 [Geodermatophilus sp.]|nr:hypothetical protein [Geodermatophilus sp.]